MGTTNSSEVVEPDRPCAIISLRSWKGVSMETLIAVPAYEEVFAHHHGHPLFSLLHSARNEPAVRHWYAAVDTNTTRCDEKKTQTTSAASATAGTATLSEELISRLVVPKDEYSEKDETTSSQGGGRGEQEVGKVDRTTELEPQVNPEDYYKELFLSGDVPTVRRWMMLTLKGPLLLHPGGGSGGINYDSSALNAPGLNGEENGFLTVEQVTQLVQQPGAEAAAAGYLECNHGALATSLRYWMVKTFSTEGRSLVLFQAAAFMEARRMQLANLRPTSPSAFELSLRVGDVSSFRMLECSFRRLLPTPQHNLLHQFVKVTTNPTTITPTTATEPSPSRVNVKIHLGALVEIMQQLEAAAQYPICPIDGFWVTLLVEHSQAKRVPTPFGTVIDAGKPLWSSQNAVVANVQPNHRQSLPFTPAAKLPLLSCDAETEAAEAPTRRHYSGPRSQEGISTGSSSGNISPTHINTQHHHHHYQCRGGGGGSSSSIKNPEKPRAIRTNRIMQCPSPVAMTTAGPTTTSSPNSSNQSSPPRSHNSSRRGSHLSPLYPASTQGRGGYTARSEPRINTGAPPVATSSPIVPVVGRGGGGGGRVAQQQQQHPHNSYQPRSYQLTDNTPVHYCDNMGHWLPLFYVNRGALLIVSPVQNYRGDGKIQLETLDPLFLVDSTGRPAVTTTGVKGTALIAVEWGCAALAVDTESSHAHVTVTAVRLFA